MALAFKLYRGMTHIHPHCLGLAPPRAVYLGRGEPGRGNRHLRRSPDPEGRRQHRIATAQSYLLETRRQPTCVSPQISQDISRVTHAPHDSVLDLTTGYIVCKASPYPNRMLIVPLEKKLDWKRPPVVTLLLIATNVMVFFFIQGDVANAHGFTPSSAAPSTFLTHMFLHGSLAHLLGNMVFLLIIGLAVELTLGWRTYLGFYVGCGLAAVVLYWAVYSTSEVPLVGASGAIAGLMGLYAVLFGARRIRFFYWVVVYFDYVKAPAIIMFPIWLANELIQLAWGGVSSVAYVAHIGGLLAGGSLAAAIRGRPGRVDTDYLDSSERVQTRNTELEKVRQLLGSLEVDRAKTTLKMLAKEYPKDREIKLQIYRVEKFDPQTEAFHHAALRFLNLPDAGPDSLRESHEVFLDYIETTVVSRIISPGISRFML